MAKLKEHDASLDSVPIEYYTTGPTLFDHDLPSLSVFDDDPLSQSKLPKRPPKDIKKPGGRGGKGGKKKLMQRKDLCSMLDDEEESQCQYLDQNMADAMESAAVNSKVKK